VNIIADKDLKNLQLNKEDVIVHLMVNGKNNNGNNTPDNGDSE